MRKIAVSDLSRNPPMASSSPQVLLATVENFLGSIVARGYPKLRKQTAAKDKGRQCQNGDAFSQSDLQGHGGRVPFSREQAEIRA